MPGGWWRLARSQDGQTAAEYTGLLLVVGAIIAVIAASPIRRHRHLGDRVRDRVDRQLARRV